MQTPPSIPREFVQQFEAAHLHRLRQRVFWYCIVVLGLLALSFTRIGLDLAAPLDAREPIGYIILRIATATTLIICYISVTIYILPAHRGRQQVINAYGVLIITTTLVVTLAMPRIDNGFLITDARPAEYGNPAAAQQGVTLFFILMLHLIASLLVDLSPRDGVRIYVPMLLIYALGLALDRYLSTAAALRLAIIAPIVGLPGLLWSLWRHRAFADQFLARAMVDRYDRVTREVAEARRVHEAMFPPPVTRGKVHVHYRYEPMLDIGGDFLFIHPLSASRTAADVPISIVVIDVTGHGFPAALAVNRLYVELTRAFASSDDPSPAHIIAELNRSMSSGLMPDGIYATAAVLRARADNGHRLLEWCGAGHPDAMLRRANGDLIHLRSSSPMLGVVDPDRFKPRDERTDFAPGDRAIAFTDGVLEAKDAAGEQFGMDRLKAALGTPSIASVAAPTVPDRSPPPNPDPASAAEVVAHPGDTPAPPATTNTNGESPPHSPADALFAAVAAFRSGPTLDDVLIVELFSAK